MTTPNASGGGAPAAAPAAAPAPSSGATPPAAPSATGAKPAATSTPKSPPPARAGGTADTGPAAAPQAGAAASGQTPGTATPSDGTAADLLDLKEAGAKYVEIVVDGKPERMKLGDALALVRKAKASDKKFNEAAQLRKEAEDRISQFDRFEQMLGDPKQRVSVLERLLGEDFDKIAEARVQEKVRRAAMSPEERKALELQEREQVLERRAREIEERDRRTKAETEARQHEERAAKVAPEMRKALGDALGKHGLGEDGRAFGELRRLCGDYLQETGKPLTRGVVAELAAIVAEDHEKISTDLRTGVWSRERETLLKLEGADLIAAFEEKLGKEALEKIRRADLDRLKGEQAQQKLADQQRNEKGQFVPKDNQPKPRPVLEDIFRKRSGHIV